MELRHYLDMAYRWWWLLLLGILVGSGVGYQVSQSKIPIYQTKTTIMVGRFIQNVNPNSSELFTARYLALSYAQMVRREPTLAATAKALKQEMSWMTLQGKVSARAIPDTQLLEITVIDTDPQQAKLIADEVSRQLIFQSPTPVDEEQEEYLTFVREQLNDLRDNITEARTQLRDLQTSLKLETTEVGIEKRKTEISTLQSKIASWQSNYASLLNSAQAADHSVNFLTVIEPAILPTSPINRSSMQEFLLPIFVGLSLAGGIVFLLEYLDDTLKTPDDVQRVLNLVPLGTIPDIKLLHRSDDRQMATGPEAFSTVAEAYRTLRTNVQFSSLVLTNPASTFLITSAVASEGKSTTAANLAVVMAHAGKRVILADADLRRPSLHHFFDLPNEVGLTGMLMDETLDPGKGLANTKIKNLQVLPSGPLPPNAADLLDSERMERLVARLSEQADVVIFDSPPILAVADASILATHVSGILLVVEAGRTRSEICRRGKEALEQVGGKFFGVVLNKFNTRRHGRYSYGYYNYYYYGGDNGREPRQKRSHKKQPVDSQPPSQS